VGSTYAICSWGYRTDRQNTLNRLGTQFGKLHTFVFPAVVFILVLPNPDKSSAMKMASTSTENRRFMVRYPIFMFGGAPTAREVLSECGPTGSAKIPHSDETVSGAIQVPFVAPQLICLYGGWYLWR
jgi:hypothetical protein